MSIYHYSKTVATPQLLHECDKLVMLRMAAVLSSFDTSLSYNSSNISEYLLFVDNHPICRYIYIYVFIYCTILIIGILPSGSWRWMRTMSKNKKEKETMCRIHNTCWFYSPSPHHRAFIYIHETFVDLPLLG